MGFVNSIMTLIHSLFIQLSFFICSMLTISVFAYFKLIIALFIVLCITKAVSWTIVRSADSSSR